VDTAVRNMITLEDLREAPLTISLSESNRILGISRGHGYTLARRGRYPVRILKLGGTYRVVTADLLALLGDAGAPRRPESGP
jgi:hypothetical protein